MTQPEALRLADELTRYLGCGGTASQAAAELRRLHAELERCKQVCAATAEAWREEAALAEPEDDALTAAYMLGRHDSKWCPIHQHHKWCEHNGGVMGPTGWEKP